MILLLFIQITTGTLINSVRVRSQESQTVSATFPSSTLKCQSGQQNVFVLNITDAYDVDLIDQNKDEIIETPYVSLDNLDLEHLPIENQCIGFPKHPQLDELMDQRIFNFTDETSYSDIVTMTDYNNIYVITQDLVLIQFKLNPKNWIASQQTRTIDLKITLGLEGQNIRTNPYFSCPKANLNCMVVSQYGSVWIPKFSDFDDDKIQIVPQLEPAISIKQEITKISTYDNVLAISYGSDGIEIYRYGYKQIGSSERAIYYMSSIVNQQMEVPTMWDIYIVSLKLINDKLFILDDQYGLMLFNVSNLQKPILIMKIKIPRAIAFDVYENTAMIVAETVNHIQYILEVFLDFDANTYYVNRVYVDDFAFRDIQMTSTYAILIAEDTHMVIKHSIFNGFVKDNKELLRTFFQDQLIRLQLYISLKEPQGRYSDTYLYVGLSRKSLHAWRFRTYNAFLACNFNSRTHKQYTLRLNSSICYQNQTQNRYVQCQSTQQIIIDSDGSLLESDSLSIIIISISISITILLTIIVLVGLKWKKIKQVLKEKQDKLNQMKQYGHFQEVDSRDKENK